MQTLEMRPRTERAQLGPDSAAGAIRGFRARSRRPYGLTATALVSSAMAGLAIAGEKWAEVDGVRVGVSSAWPSKLNQGWQPLAVRLESERDTEAVVLLSFRNGNGPVNDQITRRVVLPARGFARFEIAAPVRPNHQNSYRSTIEVGDVSRSFGDVGSQQSCPDVNRVVLVASRTATTVDAARWSLELSTEADPRLPAGARLTAMALVPPAPPAVAVWPPLTPPPPRPDNVVVGVARHEELSALAEAYSSLDALVIDPSSGPPPRAAFDAILAWGRSGGVVAVLGEGAAELVAGETALSAWAEPRFRASEIDGVSSYVFGLGVLLVAESSAPLADLAQVVALNRAIEAVAPLDAPAPRSRFELGLPGLEIPFRPLVVLLVLFAIVIGPLNLILVRRSKRPALLLLTIPVIALCFSVGLIVYGTASHGLDVRVASQTRGVLDQRSHHGTSHERRITFAGLAAGTGLRPGPGTVVQRVHGTRMGPSNSEYTVSYDETLDLAGAWLPVRTPTQHYVTVDRTARGRVDVKRGADGWTVTNGLATTIRHLVLRDAEGESHSFAGPLAPGLTAKAGAAGTAINDPFQARELLTLRGEDGAFQPRATWIARVAASPMIDTCGLEYEEVVTDHLVLGVLDLEEAR